MKIGNIFYLHYIISMIRESLLDSIIIKVAHSPGP